MTNTNRVLTVFLFFLGGGPFLSPAMFASSRAPISAQRGAQHPSGLIPTPPPIIPAPPSTDEDGAILSSQPLAPQGGGCTPSATSGDDTVTCTGSITSFQYLYGGNDTITATHVMTMAWGHVYWLDEALGGNPATDGNDVFTATDSFFSWVLAFGGDDIFTVRNSEFRNLYGDTNPGHGTRQRGSDTFLIEGSTSIGWILGGNDGDTITIKDSTVCFVASGYSDIYGGTEYTPYDGDDTVVLDNVIFSTNNDYCGAYSNNPGSVGGGKGNDSITFRNGGTVEGVAGGHGDDVITVNDGEQFTACSYQDDTTGNTIQCGIYGDEPYDMEPDPTTIPNTHGDDQIIINDARIDGITVNGGGGSDLVKIAAPVTLAGTQLDGGDDLGTADGFIDQLVFDAWSGHVNASDLKNWETIILDNSSETTFLGDKLEVGFEPGVSSATGIPFGLLVQNNAVLKQPYDLEINGNLHNRSKIDLRDNGTPGTMLTVTRDYLAENGQLYLDTELNDASTNISDQLIVEGDTQGTTTLFINNVGGTGGSTGTGPNDGILIVIVHGNSNGSFILGDSVQAGVDSVQAGNYQYHLVKGDDGNWYLQSSAPTRITLLSFHSQQPSPLLVMAMAIALTSLGSVAWWLRRR